MATMGQYLLLRQFTRLCTSVHLWERVSEIRYINKIPFHATIGWNIRLAPILWVTQVLDKYYMIFFPLYKDNPNAVVHMYIYTCNDCIKHKQIELLVDWSSANSMNMWSVTHSSAQVCVPQPLRFNSFKHSSGPVLEIGCLYLPGMGEEVYSILQQSLL